MKLSKFLEKSCDKKALLNKEKGDNTFEVMKKASSSLFTDFAHGKDWGVASRAILMCLEEKTKSSDSYLGESEQKKQVTLAQFERVYQYLSENIVKVHAFLKPVSLEENRVEDGLLFTSVDLLGEDEKGAFHAFLFHPMGKSKRSMGGRSITTSSAADPAGIIAKLALEREYPGITIHQMFLMNGEDTEKEAGAFLTDGKKGSNLFSVTYQNYYDKKTGQFLSEKLESYCRESINTLLSQEKDCGFCPYADFCDTESVFSTEVATEEKTPSTTTYQLPTLNKKQQSVVETVEGPGVVYAAPGSGKTALLVARTYHMVRNAGISAPFILLLTFTNEAAGEIRTRLASLLGKTEVPKVSTINALGYNILLDNKHIVGELKLLTEEEQNRLIKNLLTVYPSLEGFNYSVKSGDYGLYNTIRSRLKEWKENASAFFEKYPKISVTQFSEFAESYYGILSAHHYIGFDEQITLSLKLLTEHEEVLSIYRSVFQYIMVDEMQDISHPQWELIRLLAEPKNNLVVVGDDDQNLYTFRGADAQIMLDFPKLYPQGFKAVLTENYRSTQEIVSCAAQFIASNENRVEKDIFSASGRSGSAPIMVQGGSGAVVPLVERLLSEGVRPEHITVISSRNKPLEELQGKFPCKSMLAKSYLRKDAFVELLRCLMHLADGDMTYFKRLCLLYGKAPISIEEAMKEESYQKVVRVYAGGIKKIMEVSTSLELVDAFAPMCTWSNAPEVLLERINYNQLSSKEDFLSYLDELSEFGDNTKASPKRDGKLLLITAHESKGCEYPVVILLNDFFEDTPDTRKAFYVALTRAKERVFVVEDEKSVPFLQAYPDMVTEWKEVSVPC